MALVCKLGDSEGKRLEVPRRAQGSCVDRLKADVANQPRSNSLRVVVVAAVEEARELSRAAPRAKDVEQDFARNGAEGRDDLRSPSLLRQGFSA